MTDSRTSLIVPLMKARVPAEVQLEFPLPPGEEPIREEFAGDLYVTYALELAGEPARRYEHVARRHCAELGLEPAGLRRRAALNLRDRRPDLALGWYPDARAVTVTLGEGGLAAALLLDEGFLDKLAQDVEGDLVIAVPARDVFVASGTGHPDGIDKLRWAVAQVWAEDRGEEEAGPGWDVPAGSLLTRDLLVRRDGAWETLAA
ncbi:DUF1444 family protein [Actinomadura macrotermitis]|uniref:DUF1444 domain-containing protein n=1 Tax=Actinomadura macrotermitis TaxID=2585200 RepID=A0A7K0C006_9ACTN|nr:hypothetical protein [Actinomadura macrotermitis]